MQLNVSIIKTRHKNGQYYIAAEMEISGKFSQTLSTEEADAIISAFGLKQVDKAQTTRFTNNDGFTDYLYS